MTSLQVFIKNSKCHNFMASADLTDAETKIYGHSLDIEIDHIPTENAIKALLQKDDEIYAVIINNKLYIRKGIRILSNGLKFMFIPFHDNIIEIEV